MQNSGTNPVLSIQLHVILLQFIIIGQSFAGKTSLFDQSTVFFRGNVGAELRVKYKYCFFSIKMPAMSTIMPFQGDPLATRHLKPCAEVVL
jgi:hypothetical protein